MTIRRATLQDKEQIVKLVTEFDDYFSKNQLFSPVLLPFTRYKNKSKLFKDVVKDWLKDTNTFVFVAENNDELVGHIVGSIQEKPDRIVDKEGSIDEWFVTGSLRNQGLGKQLYDVLLKVFKEQSCNHIGLKVYAVNKKTIDMYHKMGFLDLEMTMVKEID